MVICTIFYTSKKNKNLDIRDKLQNFFRSWGYEKKLIDDQEFSIKYLELIKAIFESSLRLFIIIQKLSIKLKLGKIQDIKTCRKSISKFYFPVKLYETRKKTMI